VRPRARESAPPTPTGPRIVFRGGLSKEPGDSVKNDGERQEADDTEERPDARCWLCEARDGVGRPPDAERVEQRAFLHPPRASAFNAP